MASYGVTCSGAVDSYYNISYVTGSLAVTTAPLTITADNQTKAYGSALPTLTASYTDPIPPSPMTLTSVYRPPMTPPL